MSTPSSFTTADEVIATAMSVMENADTIDRAFLKQWVYLGLEQIGPNTSWYGEATLYPVEFSFRKPEDMHSPIDIALYDASGTELKYTFKGKGSRIHRSDNDSVNNGNYAPEFGSTVDLSEDAYYFNISSNGTADQVSYAILKYWKFPVDDNGDLLVPVNDTMPLIIFLRYMFYMRKDDKQGIGLTYPMWLQARREAKASHNTPSILEGSEIARTWNSMIQKQRYRQF